jgi:CubicO group peptidase (beta-lactamase class C family)
MIPTGVALVLAIFLLTTGAAGQSAPNSQVPSDDEIRRILITLIDLSTHTSGLPRLPSNFHPKDPANPYDDCAEEQLYQRAPTHGRSRRG